MIRQHYVFLVDNLDVENSTLLDELHRAEVISEEERDSISREVMSFFRQEKLLSVLSRKTEDQFDRFLDALDETGQQHVRNHITGREGHCCCLIVIFSVALFSATFFKTLLRCFDFMPI